MLRRSTIFALYFLAALTSGVRAQYAQQVYDGGGFASASGAITCTAGGVCTLAPASSIATSLAIGGATIGTNALAVTGTSSLAGTVVDATGIITTSTGGNSTRQLIFTPNSGNSIALGIANGGSQLGWFNSAGQALGSFVANGVNLSSDMAIRWSNATNNPFTTIDTIFSRNAAGIVQFGTTTNNASGSWLATNGTISGTLIAGTADATTSTGGALQVTGGASIAKRFWIPAITASAGLQTAVLCQSSGGEMIADSVACLASAARFKNVRGTVEDGALEKIMKLPIALWSYKQEGLFVSDTWTRERVGPLADDVAAMDPRLAGYDEDGQVRSYSTEQLLAFTIKALQELKADNDNLRSELYARTAR